MAMKTPLRTRPLDLVYFIFFLIHLPASLLLDCQPLYPSGLVPTFISQLPKIYIQISGDPLMGGLVGSAVDGSNLLWLKTFIFLEAFFQVPVFILGMRGLWRDSCSIYPLLLIYGASTATTVLPCLTVLLSTPITSASTIVAGVPSVTEGQRLMLLSSYVPFFVLPAFMTVDMAMRISKLVCAGVAAMSERKAC